MVKPSGFFDRTCRFITFPRLAHSYSFNNYCLGKDFGIDQNCSAFWTIPKAGTSAIFLYHVALAIRSRNMSWTLIRQYAMCDNIIQILVMECPFRWCVSLRLAEFRPFYTSCLHRKQCFASTILVGVVLHCTKTKKKCVPSQDIS